MKKMFCVIAVLALLGSLALPAFAVETDTGAVVTGPDLVLEFFPALFDGITSILQAPPMLYLFSIFVLASIILIFKLIFHF